ncbi:MAG: cob(I)yrinic acid a,c-diamide adenosyltransferase [Bryobacteraceae bacterium]
MSNRQFDPPRLTIARVYTRSGDEGKTGLVGGQRVAKDTPRLEAYGVVDELNAFVGASRATAEALVDRDGRAWTLVPILLRIQHELFNLGSILATLPEDVHERQPRVTEEDVTRLETEMDRVTRDLPPLHSFVLPGSGRLNADLHLCRVVCRRAERSVVALARIESVPPEAIRYLNRLSDAFFVWSRWATHVTGDPETLWDPNHASSARPGA